MSSKRTNLAVVLAVLAISGCGGSLVAPDSLDGDPGDDAFVDHLVRVCGKLDIGRQPLNYLVQVESGDANIDFIDQTSKLYFGRIDRHTYASNINAFLPGDNQPVLDCIFAQLEQVPGR
ncbi:MAG: hypothetical protein WAT36_11555 [Chromatiaceae bacterium]